MFYWNLVSFTWGFGLQPSGLTAQPLTAVLAFANAHDASTLRYPFQAIALPALICVSSWNIEINGLTQATFAGWNMLSQNMFENVRLIGLITGPEVDKFWWTVQLWRFKSWHERRPPSTPFAFWYVLLISFSLSDPTSSGCLSVNIESKVTLHTLLA